MHKISTTKANKMLIILFFLWKSIPKIIPKSNPKDNTITESICPTLLLKLPRNGINIDNTATMTKDIKAINTPKEI